MLDREDLSLAFRWYMENILAVASYIYRTISTGMTPLIWQVEASSQEFAELSADPPTPERHAKDGLRAAIWPRYCGRVPKQN